MKRDERMFEKPISINYLKLQPYFGSYNGTSFALIKKEDKLEAYLYPGPFGFDATPDEKKLKQEFEFSDTGYAEAVAWMDEHYKDYENILVVSHGNVIKTILMNLFGYSPEWFSQEKPINNCEVALIDEEKKMKILRKQ